MNLEMRDSRVVQLLAPDSAVEQVVTGFDFTEGPIWHPTARALIFSDIMGNSLYRWSAATGLQKVRRNSYMANGNAFDHQGRIITCEHATSRVTRSDLAHCDPLTNEGIEVLATHYQGKQLNSPNDVVVKRDGTIYFTDPAAGRSVIYGIPREPELPFAGVYRLDPTTKALTLLVDDFVLPNGLCFSRDEGQLFVNDTRCFHIRVFDIQPDGTLANGRLWAETTGEGASVPDGMKVDQAGNIYCCGPGGIHLFDPNANCLGVIHLPEPTANFVFGDEDLCTLYITASTTLYRVRVKIPGHATFAG
ncbi:MAG: SMP-30/gluconolactonase/LRE family protein [Caldilineaceae bacterium]|nr:SMP-30/gluconolactonase/LRE family protein [Caldilineaceae bacterium]